MDGQCLEIVIFVFYAVDLPSWFVAQSSVDSLVCELSDDWRPMHVE